MHVLVPVLIVLITQGEIEACFIAGAVDVQS